MDVHANRSYKVVISTAVSFAIATSALLLRLVSRWLCRKRLELNDYFILAAYIPKLGIDIASILLVIYGIGQHIEVVSPEDRTNYLKVVYGGSFLYASCIAFIKLSILSLYWVAFPSFRYMKISITILSSIVISWGIALCIVGLLQCLPIRKAWTPELKEGSCINLYEYYYGLQIPNIITDVAILILPFKACWDLKLGLGKTIQLSSVFALGIATCIFDIIRLVVFLQTPSNMDITWNEVGASMWTDLEPSVAFLVACLPIMRPLITPRRFWRARRESKQREEIDDSYDIDAMTYSSHETRMSAYSSFDREAK